MESYETLKCSSFFCVRPSLSSIDIPRRLFLYAVSYSFECEITGTENLSLYSCISAFLLFLNVSYSDWVITHNSGH